MATKFTDGNKMVEIRMTSWEPENTGYAPDWEADFFDVGFLPYVEEMDAFQVEDLEYIIEQAEDWQSADGDFVDDRDDADPEELENRTVFVEWISTKTKPRKGRPIVAATFSRPAPEKLGTVSVTGSPATGRLVWNTDPFLGSGWFVEFEEDL